MTQPRHSETARLSRRELLRSAAGLGAGLGLPGLLSRPLRAESDRLGARVLVLLELNGGNDGLNTVVPYADPLYARARPDLAIPRDRVLPLDERLGLNPALEPLMPLWQERQLAIALGIGYERPNRSHFRSIEIWNTASASDEVLQRGWVARVRGEAGASHGAGLAADAVVLGGSIGPLTGSGLRTVVMTRPDRFLRQADALAAHRPETGNPALAHILRIREEIHDSAQAMRAKLDRAPALATRFPSDPLGRQFAVAARLIAAGTPIGAIKLAQTGYDTHAGQVGKHRQLLAQLAASLAAFHAAMLEAGTWERVLVVTYAEFGRRAAQNGSRGTDHGTAAPHFLLGGRVRGGLYGTQPRLDDLDSEDLRHGLDFRRLYATAAQGWWGLPPTPDALGRARPLPCLA